MDDKTGAVVNDPSGKNPLKDLISDSAFVVSVITALLPTLGIAMEVAYLESFNLPVHKFLPAMPLLIFKGFLALWNIASPNWVVRTICIAVIAVIIWNPRGLNEWLRTFIFSIKGLIVFGLAFLFCFNAAQSMGRDSGRKISSPITIELKNNGRIDGTFITFNEGAYALRDKDGQVVIVDVADIEAVKITPKDTAGSREKWDSLFDWLGFWKS